LLYTKGGNINTKLLCILKQIIAAHGESILADPQKLKPLFSDRAKGEPKEQRAAFGHCIEIGAYQALKTAGSLNERRRRKTLLADMMCAKSGIDKTQCEAALDLLEMVMFAVPSQQPVPPSAAVAILAFMRRIKKPPKRMFFFVLLFIALFSFALSQRQVYQPRIIDWSGASFENDVLPLIIEQMNHTAASFFYDLDRFNRMLEESGLPIREEPVGNFIVGHNERAGVCQDYAAHFIHHYRGLGEIYFVSVNAYGETALLRRVKRFARSDITIENPLQLAIDSREIINRFYREVRRSHQRHLQQGSSWGWSFGMHGWVGDESREWHIGPYIFNSNEDGSLYLLEKISIPTPLSHAGKTEGFFNHAWVRIIWRDMIIDVDPTWYDNGLPFDLGSIAVITLSRGQSLYHR